MSAYGDCRDEWATRLRTLFAAELAAREIYLVDTLDSGPAFRTRYAYGDDVLAFTACAIDLDLQPRLQSLGLWRGRGFVIVVPDLFRLTLLRTADQLGVLLHEFAHCLDMEPRWQAAWENRRFIEAIRKIDPDMIARIDAELARRPRPTLPPGPPWRFHELQFTRVALHAWHRACLAGWRVDVTNLFVAGWRYGLSPVHAYHERLQDELRRHEAEPIGSIIAQPTPRDFADLWQADVAAFDDTYAVLTEAAA